MADLAIDRILEILRQDASSAGRVTGRTGRRVSDARRAVGLRQVDPAANHCRSRVQDAGEWRSRAGAWMPSPQGPRRGHGVPGLRALSAPLGLDNIALPLRVRRLGPMQRLPLFGRLAADRACSRAEIAAEVQETAGVSRSPTARPQARRNCRAARRQRVALGRAMVRRPARVPDGRAAVQSRCQAAGADARRDHGAAPAAAAPRSSS